VPRECPSAGQWQAKTACQFVCHSGACAGVCAPGASRCFGLEAQTCQPDGQWLTSQVCEFVCSNSVCSGLCSPGSVQCDGQNLQQCSGAGQWQTIEVCPFACAQSGCTGVCSPGQQKCSGLTVQQCDASGQWADVQTCAAGPHSFASCSNGACGTNCISGYGDCDGDAANGCEVNLVSNDAPSVNCGQCGHSCAGGWCMNSKCSSVYLATDSNAVLDVQADSDYVYYGVQYGRLMKVSVNGGAPVQLAQTDGLNSMKLAIDTNYVYWTTSSSYVRRIAKTGGAVATLTSGAGKAHEIVVDDMYAYFASHGSGTIQKVPLSGGTLQTIGAGAPNGLALDPAQDAIVWTDVDSVRGHSLMSSASWTVASGQSTPKGIVVDQAVLYWVNAGTQKAVMKSGAVLALDAASGPIALDAGYVYWTNDAAGAIKRVPREGGAIEVVATGGPYSSIAVDSQVVYFGASSVVGKIAKP